MSETVTVSAADLALLEGDLLDAYREHVAWAGKLADNDRLRTGHQEAAEAALRIAGARTGQDDIEDIKAEVGNQSWARLNAWARAH